MEIAKHFARELLDIGAVKLNAYNPFQWTSGWLSPIYCDNRLTLSYPSLRNFVKSEMSFMTQGKFPEAEAIAGVATAGIPHGVLISDYLDLPFIYVRGKTKEHGLENQIEGKVVPGQPVVVVEDLISTGSSVMQAIHALKEKGVHVLGTVALFSYGFEEATKKFEKEKMPFFSLSNFDVLIEEALKVAYIDNDSWESLLKWRSAPAEWRGLKS